MIDLKLRRNTIYLDLKDLPDPIYLGISARCFNLSASNLSFYLTGEGADWIFPSSNAVGTILSGRNHRYNAHNFCRRSKPSAETVDSIVAILTAGPYEIRKTINIHFIKSDDGSWTENEHNDFDDGSKQGWSHIVGSGKNSFIVSEYAMSPPYAFRGTTLKTGWGFGYQTIELTKNFTTPDKAYVYGIAYVRTRCQGVIPTSPGTFDELDFSVGASESYKGYLGWKIGEYPYDEMVKLGRPPTNQWMKLTYPMEADASVAASVKAYFYQNNANGCYGHLYLDDFSIISKD